MKASKWVLNMLLWTWGGTVYYTVEIIYKTLSGKPETISWTMLYLAIFLCIPLERFGAELPWEMALWKQALICGSAITVCEFISGCILNLWLGLGIWDYSNLPLNLFGQACVPFWIIWCVVSMGAIVLYDWIRYAVQGSEKPHYYIR